MSMTRWIFGGLIAALGSAAFSQPIPVPPIPISTQTLWPLQNSDGASPVVVVKLNPDLGEHAGAVRDLIATIPFARIGDNADFEITNTPDFPFDIRLEDITEPPNDWLVRGSSGNPDDAEGPRRIRVGNLEEPDIALRLSQPLLRLFRIKSLLSASRKIPSPALQICVQIVVERAENEQPCRDLASIDKVWIGDRDFSVELRITNRSAQTQHVAILSMDRSLAIKVAALAGDAPNLVIAPGETLRERNAYRGYGDGQLVVINSASPIDLAALEQSYPGSAGPNPSKGVEIDPAWTVVSSRYYIDRPSIAFMGGGVNAIVGMAPWMAALYSTVPYKKADFDEDAAKPPEKRQYLANRSAEERAHRCGGTLIAVNLVVTAAHCVAKGQYAGEGFRKVFKQRRIRLGSADLGYGGATYPVTAIAVHSGYDPDGNANDIALLLIGQDRGSVRQVPPPALLPDEPVAAGAKVMGFGWGYTGTVKPGADPLLNMAAKLQHNPGVLQVGQMVTLDWKRCQKKVGNLLGPRMVCVTSPGIAAGDPRAKNVFSCRGDSGGPLIKKRGARDVLVGVTNWSMGCGYKDYPSVYADVGKYRAWINAARAVLKPGVAKRVPEPQAAGR